MLPSYEVECSTSNGACTNAFQKAVDAGTTDAGTKVNDAQNEADTKMSNQSAKRHPCPSCDKIFKSATGLGQHYQKHTGEFSYKCEICDKGFTVKSNFTQHMAKHQGKKFPCNLCEKVFRSRTGLLRHSKEHKPK